MRKQCTLLLFLLGISIGLKAQNIDSLINIIKHAPEDTNMLPILTAIVENAPDSIWQHYNDQLYRIAERLMLSPNPEIRKTAKKGYANSLSNMGYNWVTKRNYTEALRCYDKCINLLKEINDPSKMAIALNSVGAIYDRQGESDKALQYYVDAVKIDEYIHNESDLVLLFSNIGVIYSAKKNYEKALEYYKKAEKIMLKNNYANINVSSVFTNIGNLLFKKNDYVTALAYYQKAYKIATKIDDQKGITKSLFGISVIYNKEGRYKEAIQLARQSLTLATNSKDLYNVVSISTFLTELYRKQGDYKIAFEMYHIETMAKDSLNSKENEKAVIHHQFQADFDIKQAWIQAVQEKKDVIVAKEMQRQRYVRNGFIGGTLLCLLLAGAIFMGLSRISRAKKKSDELLLNILPAEVAEELKEKGTAEAKHFENVSVLFTDFVGFTFVSESLTAKELVNELHTCFKAFDDIIVKHGIEKIKTIGDAYLAVCGLPVANELHAEKVVRAAIEIRTFMLTRREKYGNNTFEIRIGINSGNVVAGIVGVKKFAYDIWGDTVNTAARMEQHSEPGKINISGRTYELVKDKFTCTYRGKVDAKNKGEIDMYFVE